ncbi:MAG: hypothetical protein QGI58_01975 [Candidatus Thalassarchaeaceae archaeon]|jgi:hypothetical protein|nr:hypothetical protein [Candidatus Thalassarchaeaceae archaeon]
MSAGGAEIVLVIIFMIFSGIWSAIKWVDEQTDNKWVFLVPASVLGLAIFMEIGGGFLFWVFLLALGPVVVMLTKVGLEQGKVPRKRSYSPRSNQGRKTRKSLDLNRELAPSYIRAYDRLIAYIQARGGDIKSLEDGRQRLAEIWGASDSGRFFDSPYVIKVLGLKEEVVEEKKEEIIGDDWWEEGYSVDNSKDLPKAKTGEESCGHSGCDNSVSAFDFRCFTCRNRFCSEHAGSKIECDGCSK